MSEPPRVAFKLGGLKRPTINTTAPSITHFDTSTANNNHNDNQAELVTGFDNGEIKSNAPTITKTELVIPSEPNAHHKFFKLKETRKDPPSNTNSTSLNQEDINQIADEAKRALILEAQQVNNAWSERNENGTVRVRTIEQDATNTFMTNEDADEQKKIDLEKEVESADYEQVPIEEFGMAVLRGMGYKEDSGLGISNKKTVSIHTPEVRPRGLGLGADRKVLEKINQLKRNLKQAGIDEKDDLCFEKGANVLIEKGLHVDQYGTIESIEEDTARLTVSLAIGGTNRKKEVISISQYNVKLVTEKEFLKYSKYVNKSKAEKVEKETSDQLMKDYHRRSEKNDDDDDNDHNHKSRHSSKRDHDDHKRHRSSRDDDNYDRKHDRHHSSSNGHRQRYEESSRSRKH